MAISRSTTELSRRNFADTEMSVSNVEKRKRSRVSTKEKEGARRNEEEVDKRETVASANRDSSNADLLEVL